MKSSRGIFGVCTLLLAGLGLAPVAARAVPVQNISVQFTSLTDGKDQGSAVSFFIQNNSGAVIAGLYDFAKGPLPGKAISPEYPVPITHGPISSDDLHAFKVTVQMQAPAGKTDTWQFNYVIKIHMANGGTITRQVSTCSLKSTGGGAASLAREVQL
jgi:hypothetical protein